ncbi:hypothetical protein MPTK1_5g02280 [Marchantia polymorpha subsp. ruderalis]|uniref:NADP-dependent oxidoreductase domain-containing protein n=2 Tax=Marchantia polymorpha TaxID=3197 RepID=A0A176W284_MARPO|nr:hypothetical protein AXG93_1406s1240 [Marchantia polymorpha subsp. ruderalis]PTQ29142.1 hypothetical protein MARPO_0147s0021 [Marchantia polymorpha]BBN10281.1 hypothetical protein Mp_5g02280 [Marchantia polymorpha subsp. ruderalis]|eukprot:PTQ29142.1 hypothetical protein MARPO_0147s0021 [Marchantia polymorpha]
MAHAQDLRDDKSVEEAYFTLRSKHQIPALGLGTWKAEPNVVRDAVYSAIVENGYRHIDCAHVYGNEKEVGAGLKAAFDAGIKRDDIFVTSKLWIKFTSPEKVKDACQQTLKDLGLTYLDLYLIHWPIYLSEDADSPPKKRQVLPFDVKGVWREMEGLVERKLVRDIGISNFSVPKLEKLMSFASIKPAVNQVEMHPSWRNDNVLAYCNKNNIHVTAYSPLGSSSTDLFDTPEVIEAAEKLGKSPGQILIRWLIQRGVSTIPKSSSDKRIKENMEVFDFSIPAEDMDKLSSISSQVRTNAGEELLVSSEDDKDAILNEFWDGEM